MKQGNFEEKEALAMVQRVEDSFQCKAELTDSRLTGANLALSVSNTHGVCLTRTECV